MVISKKFSNPKCNVVSRGKQTKQVTKFKYLGYLITSDGRCTSKISKRIAMAKDTFQKMNPILANRNISMKIKIRYPFQISYNKNVLENLFPREGEEEVEEKKKKKAEGGKKTESGKRGMGWAFVDEDHQRVGEAGDKENRMEEENAGPDQEPQKGGVP
ncbi:RNA-directed DNA polymerase from mobile element jockey-like [Plakobranchus ocellatus]|uniref:RNA-directed DNA polymerase from mobile element jockey-like n=1 Tax=Plakobranchus ocellatus TaxID=259542 RepID=A0AAV4B2E6_9GAST|nr:RNA-directed DNA polymerase from mobile element jockey-like [Plakobranchus ocellatus]